jgi:hypothetical protein
MVTKERRVRIIQDSDPGNPREERDNLGTIVCFHRRYDLGDEHPRCHPEEWRRSLADSLVGGFKTWLADIPAENIQKALDKHLCVMLPLYLYDHGGLTISTGSFSCRWDSGQVGWIYCDWEKARENYPGCPDEEVQERTLACLEAGVKTYDQYLRGEVYGYQIEEREPPCECCGRAMDWDVVDSCWRFYGDDWKTNGMADHWSEEDRLLVTED